MNKRIGLSGTDSLRSDSVVAWNYHAPGTHGMLQIDLQVENEIIQSATPLLGSMHRGAEKLFESRDYRQVLGLANRHEWLSAFSGEVGIACLIERELGIDVPLGAQWVRTLLLEVFRVSSHLAFLAGYPWNSSSITQSLRQNREHVVLHMRSYSGSRMHPMLTQIGGLTHAPTKLWLTELAQILKEVEESLRCLRLEIIDELNAMHGVGLINAQQISEFALSGPVARAGGVAIDLRPNTKQLTYHQLSTFSSATQSAGDVHARILQLLQEIDTSKTMLDELIEKAFEFIDQDVNVLIPKVLRVPEGEYEFSLETPLGIASWLLISKGDKYPYRMALRPASLHTVLALRAALPGNNEALLTNIVASMPFIAGDADR